MIGGLTKGDKAAEAGEDSGIRSIISKSLAEIFSDAAWNIGFCIDNIDDVKNSITKRINSANPRPIRRTLSLSAFGTLSIAREIKIKLSTLSIVSSSVSVSKVQASASIFVPNSALLTLQ